MQVPLWDNRSGIPARDAWGRFVAERHRVQWPNLTFEMAASVRFSSKRYCRAEIVMFCLFFCIFFKIFFKIFKIFQDFFLVNLSIFIFFPGRGLEKLFIFNIFFGGLETCLFCPLSILSVLSIFSELSVHDCRIVLLHD